ncbi:histidine kinase [hydrothermal vent metagenome]|uniref:Histidine kinase n=1 Tax=hydrothermal vent metagenome TaxID=652676 RepID=A0A1W1D3E6_9ZZZZ
MKSYIYKIGESVTTSIPQEQKEKIYNALSVLIQVFCGEGDEKFQEILSFLTLQFPNAIIIGASTDGEIFHDKVTTQNSIISISLFEHTTLEAFYVDTKESFCDGSTMAHQLMKKDIKLLLTFADGIAINGEEYLNGIASVAPSIKVAGGLAGDNGNLQKTTIAIGDKLYHSGAVGVALFSDVLQVKSLYSFGWKSIGIAHKITSSRKNRVFLIDDMSAVDFYAKYLGKGIAKLLPSIGIEFPLVMKKDGVEIARAVLEKHLDGSLSFAGNIEEGAEVYLGVGSKEEIVSSPIRSSELVVESFFIYSCMARRRFLPEFIEYEIAPFTHLAPTSGFFTYGEFYTDKKPELLNQTLTAVALSESDVIKRVNKSENQKKENKNITREALTNILNQTSKDLIAMSELRQRDIISSQEAKLVQMGEMVNMIAHQWRQPLNAISAASIKLSMQAQLGIINEEEIVKTMEFIEQTTQDMSKTINDFMNFTKPTDEKVRVKLQDILDDILRMMGAQLKNHNINFVSEVEDDFEILTFSKDLEHILLNLFSNARDAFDTKEIPNKEIKVISFVRKKDCVIEVVDNAGGIPKDVIGRVFDPYFTTKEQGKGTGLGLYMSKKLLTETIGGIIEVKNIQDGAKFTIILKDAVC